MPLLTVFPLIVLFLLFLSEPVRIAVALKAPTEIRADFVFLAFVFSPGKPKKAAKRRKKANRKKRKKKTSAVFSWLYAFSVVREKIDVACYLPDLKRTRNFENSSENTRQKSVEFAFASIVSGFFSLLFHSFAPIARPYREDIGAPVCAVSCSVFTLLSVPSVYAFSRIRRKF